MSHSATTNQSQGRHMLLCCLLGLVASIAYYSTKADALSFSDQLPFLLHAKLSLYFALLFCCLLLAFSVSSEAQLNLTKCLVATAVTVMIFMMSLQHIVVMSYVFLSANLFMFLFVVYARQGGFRVDYRYYFESVWNTFSVSIDR